MSRPNLQRQLERRTAEEEEKRGIRVGHYLLDGNFVDVWVSFYPKVRWWIADATRVTGERIKGTTRPLDEATQAKLKSWL